MNRRKPIKYVSIFTLAIVIGILAYLVLLKKGRDQTTDWNCFGNSLTQSLIIKKWPSSTIRFYIDSLAMSANTYFSFNKNKLEEQEIEFVELDSNKIIFFTKPFGNLFYESRIGLIMSKSLTSKDYFYKNSEYKIIKQLNDSVVVFKHDFGINDK